MEQTIQTQPAGKGKKILLIGLGLAATGTLGYFGYEWYKRSKTDNNSDAEMPDMDLTPPSQGSFTPPPAPVKRNDDFPLHKGSKGTRVKQVQDALIEKHGKEIFPKYGADGDFGSEMVTALSKLSYPASIDENTFNVIVQGGGLDNDETATDLYNAATKKDFASAIKSLQTLKSKEDYTSVSESFKNNFRINGVRQTLVNGMLNSFSDEKQKQAIRLQFTRMGLNYDGKTWSLSGIESSSIITKKTALVWVHPKKAIKVPANMVLGKMIAHRGKHLLFENKGKHFLVDTKSVAFL